MKAYSALRETLLRHEPGGAIESVAGRGGQPTARIHGVLLHSQYNPEEEARRLVDSVDLYPDRPVLVVGLGLGYHVEELIARGYELCVIEPSMDTAALAARRLPEELACCLVLGDCDAALRDETFIAWLRREPQVLVHPATARVYPTYVDATRQLPAFAAIRGKRLNIAVVGAMFGGSTPISGYLANAFTKLGHHVRHVENSMVWPVYDAVASGSRSEKAKSQLTDMLTRFMAEWSYARVAEFNPEICIVMAQAPVLQDFPERLRKHGVVSAYWYVENWRHLPYWRDIAALYDCFFHIQPGEFEKHLDDVGCRCHAFIQTGCDPAVHRPVSLKDYEKDAFGSDISFAGAGYHNRNELFKGLTDYRFKLWGVNWKDRYLAPLVVGGERRFDNETFMKIVAGAKISLNLHSSALCEGVDLSHDAINPRVFEIAAAGGFQVCDPCIGLENCFDFDTELPVYRTLKELRALIDYYLDHGEERRAIAVRAQARALKEHTYENRAQAMIEHILLHHGAQIHQRGVRAQYTVSEIADRLDAEDALGKWLRTLPSDMLFTTENIEGRLQPDMMKRLSYPEKLFAYLKEMRAFAEAMMKEHR